MCLKITFFFTASVACAIAPSLNTFSIFHIFRIFKKTFNNVNTLRAQLIFPSKPNFFTIYLNFQQQKSLQNQYLLHLSSQDCEINSIKSDPSRAFQQDQEYPQIPIQFSVLILLSFHWENDSIINSFRIIAPNSLETKWGQPPYSSRAFQRHQEWGMKHSGFGRSEHDQQNKTNYLAS